MEDKYIPPILRTKYQSASVFLNPGNKKQRLVGNAAARLLMGRGKFTKTVRERLLSLADVFVAVVDYEAPSPPLTTLTDYMFEYVYPGYVSAIGTFDNFRTGLEEALLKEPVKHHRECLTAYFTLGLTDPVTALKLIRLFAMRRHPKYKLIGNKAQQFVNVANNLPRYEKGLSNEDTFFNVASLAAFFRIARELTSVSALMAACYQFMRSMRFSDQVIELFRTLALTLLEAVPNFESGKEDSALHQLFEIPYSVLTKTDIGTALMTLLSSFSIIGVLSSLCFDSEIPVWKQRIDSLTRLLASEKTNVTDTFIQRLLRFISLCVTRAGTALAKGDTSFLFGATLPFPEWNVWTDHLLYSTELVFDPARTDVQKTFVEKMRTKGYGSQISKQLERKEMKDELLRALSMFQPILDAYGSVPAIVVSLKKKKFELEEKVRNIENILMNGSFRIQPYGIFIPGPPGVGKSEIIRIIHQCLAQKLNRDSHESSMHIIQPTQNFPIFDPSQWFAVADDLDINPSLPAAGTGSNHGEIIMKYINTTPLNMEAADIPNKGKNWANFLAVAYATNNPDGRLKYALTDPYAFWRRMKIRLTLTVKGHYCDSTGALDPTKIPEGDQNIWSVIQVDKVDKTAYTEGGAAPYTPYRTFTNLPEFLIWLGAEVSIHLNRASAHRTFSGERCSVCSCFQVSHPNNVMCDPDSRSRVVSGLPPVIATPVYTSGLPRYENGFLVNFAYNYLWIQVYYYLAGLVGLLYVLWTGSHDNFWVWFRAIRDFTVLSVCHRFVSEGTKLKMMIEREFNSWRRNLKRTLLVGAVTISGLSLAIYGLVHLMKPKPRFESDTDKVVPVPNLQPSNSGWVRKEYTTARPYEKLPARTFTKTEMIGFIQRSQVVITYLGGNFIATHMAKNKYLTVWHGLGDSPNSRLTNPNFGNLAKVRYGTMVKEVIIDATMVQQIPGKDLCLIYLPEIAPVKPLLSKIANTSMAVDLLQADAAELVKPNEIIECRSFKTARKFHTFVAKDYYWNYDADTNFGDCGALGVATFANNFAIVSLHFGSLGSSGAFGENIYASEIQLAMDAIEVRHPCSEVHYDKGFLTVDGNVELTELPLKSNLWCNLSSSKPMSVLVGGCIPNCVGTTFKSGVVDMPYKSDWADLELKVCGSNNYYVKPQGGGRMVDGEWKSPFTRNMEASSDIGGSMEIWRLAIDDYIDGARLLIGRDRVRVLSEYESVMGVPFTDIGSVDLQTSVGPPFNRKKQEFLRLDHVQKTCEFSESLQRTFDILDSHIMEGYGLSAVCNYVLKDEPVSQAKNDAFKVRVFNVLPFCFNTRLKQYLGPILVFMRRHPFFFETAIGMNVTSYQWKDLDDWLAVHPHWSAADNSDFDTRMSTREGLATIYFFLDLAFLFHYNQEEMKVLSALLFSCLYTTRICKGDVWYSTYMMPTGFWVTILFNTVRNCLQRRYCFMRIRPSPNLKFRDGIRQITLGDDNKATTKWDWYNQQAIQVAAREFGAVITDANKSAVVPLFDTRESATFLKRYSRVLDGVVVAPIELKTLVKMVTVRTKSSLSTVDHVCQLYSNVLSEAWMHGPEIFEIFSVKISSIMEREKWVSTYYVHLTYAEYLQRYKDGNLSIWDPLLNQVNFA